MKTRHYTFYIYYNSCRQNGYWDLRLVDHKWPSCEEMLYPGSTIYISDSLYVDLSSITNPRNKKTVEMHRFFDVGGNWNPEKGIFFTAEMARL